MKSEEPDNSAFSSRTPCHAKLTEIDASSFRANLAESNRITIADRTIKVPLAHHPGGGASFRTISEPLVLQASLLDSATSLDEAPSCWSLPARHTPSCLVLSLEFGSSRGRRVVSESEPLRREDR
jgi:hypothetical protein